MNKIYLLIVFTLTSLLFGCGSGSGSDDANSDSNRSPEITGSSTDFVRSGNRFEFTPTTFDPDNDGLLFTITNKPDWAVFDQNTGALSGTPDDLSVGHYQEITITVSDGTNTVSLPSFTLKVMYAEVGRNNVQLDPAAMVTVNSNEYVVIGDAAIVVGNLATDFKNADLQFEYDADGNLLDLVGDTDLPPVISDTLSVDSSVRAVVGMFTGAEINARTDIGPDSAPGIWLRDEFRYLVYFLNTSVDLTFHGGKGIDIPINLAGTQTLIITDPTDPFFYYFGEIAGISLGYGKSFNGNIPYKPLFEPNGPIAFASLEPFLGTDILKGTFPISAFKVLDVLELSGTAVCSPPQLLDCDKPTPVGMVLSLAEALLLDGGVDPTQQFKLGINGTAAIAFRIFGIDLFTYHLLDVASQIDIGTVREHIAIQGVVDTQQSDSPSWIPIKPVPDLGVVMVGNLFADVDTQTGQGDFGISLYGEFPSTFPAATISGSISINPQGMQMVGSIPDPANPITVTATVDAQEMSAGIEFGYDFAGTINAVVDDGIDRALAQVDQVTQDLQDAIGDYDIAFSLDGFRNNIPALIDTVIGILNGVPGKVYNTVYNNTLSGINSKSYSYNPCSPITNCTITIYASDYVNETSIAKNAATDARNKARGIIDSRIAELNELKAQAQEIKDGPVFRAALKTALETVAANDKVPVTVPKETITVNYVVTTKTYTVYSGGTLNYTAFDSTTKSNLETAAANVENIDPAQTFMFSTQQIFDQLPTKDELNQVVQDVNDGIIDPPDVKGGGYTVTRAGDQSAYVLLGNDKIIINFNPLDPAAAIEGVGDAIVQFMTP